MRNRRTRAIATVAALACACLCVLAFALASPQPTLPGAAPAPAPGAPEAVIEGAAATGGSAGTASGGRSSGGAPGDDPAAYEPGAVLVTLADGATADQMLAVLSAVPDLAGAAMEDQVSDDLVKLSLPPGTSVGRAVDLLAGLAPVAAAQPNYRYYIQEGTAQAAASQATALAAQAADLSAVQPAEQPSPLASQALAVNDPGRARQWALDSIKAPDAWERVTATAGSKRVTVAVMDEGFLTTHEDLAGVIASPYDAVSSTSSALAAYNKGHSEHGTHVAGIIAAQANNAKGVAGVSYNTSSYSTCKVMPIKVADSRGDITTDTLVKAYNYLLSSSGSATVAQKLNVRVVNLSLGTSREEQYDVPDRSLRSAISKAWSNGIITVAAACNIDDGKYNQAFYAYPCDFSNVVGVIGLEKSGNSDGVERDPTSNFNATGRTFRFTNESKNISAPGADIYSTYTDDSANPATDQYRSMSGTSMATPVVSGVLALMFKANPDLTAQQAVSALYSTARDLTEGSGAAAGWDRATGYGEADADAAVAAVAPAVNGPADIAYGSTGTFSVYVGAERQDATAFTWTSSDERVAKVAQVSASGCVVAPVGSGTATIKAVRGNLAATQEITVAWPAVTGPQLLARGDAYAYSVSVGGRAEPAASWVWASSDPGVVQVAPSGDATAVAEGSARLTATNAANGFTIVRDVTVSHELSVQLLDISVPDATYTGAPLTPSPVVKNGSFTLSEGRDYRVTGYAGNLNAGTATVAVEGRGDYAGAATATFTVRPASIANATISLSATSFTYNGKVRKPSVQSVTAVVGGRLRTLANGADYTLSNPGVKKGAGKVVATAKAGGNFTGATSATYTVSVVKKKVYQLYNRKTGQWLYTTSAAERAKKVAKGWTGKGTAFKVPSKSTKPVWRLYNPKTKGYRYTASAKKRAGLVASGWRYQKVAFYSDDYKAKRIYAHYRKATKSWRYSTSLALTGYTRKSTLAYAL